MISAHGSYLFLHSLVAMGGAVRSAGNASPLAEANFLHDAWAARLVVSAFSTTASEAAGRLVLAPLDLTHLPQSLISKEEVGRIRTYGAGARLFADAWLTYQKVARRTHSMLHARAHLQQVAWR